MQTYKHRYFYQIYDEHTATTKQIEQQKLSKIPYQDTLNLYLVVGIHRSVFFIVI